MLRFDDLQLFVRAADLGSLSAAARVMDLSPAVASAALKRIEEHLAHACWPVPPAACGSPRRARAFSNTPGGLEQPG